jgi:hypothetical protein
MALQPGGNNMKKRLMFVMTVLLAVLLTTAGCQYLPGEFNNPFKTNEPPKAYIDSISPTAAMQGETVTFLGHGTDSDGTIVAYRWYSDIDGEIGVKDYFQTSSLSSGQHTINFKVQDNNGDWSEEISYSLVIEGNSASLPVISYFNATSDSIVRGDKTTIRWDTVNATNVTIQPDIGSVEATGSKVIAPNSTITYTLVAGNDEGSVSTALKITVSTSQTGLPTINSFSASPAIISAGKSAVLSWNVSNATKVSINPSIGTVSSTGSATVTPSRTTNYTLTARNSAGQVSYNISVVIISLPVSEYTVVIEPVASESGYVQSNGDAWPTLLYVGDTTDNVSVQSFISFNISSIPSGAIIQEVIVDFSDYDAIEGTPFSDLGCMNAFDHYYGTLDGSDYYIGTQENELFQYCATSHIGSHTSSKVKNALQSKLGNSRFQMRLQFDEHETDDENDDDLIHWSPYNIKLIVTYTTV